MRRAQTLAAVLPLTLLATTLLAQSPTGAWFGEIREGDKATPLVITLDTAAGGLKGEIVLPLTVPHRSGMVRLVRMAPPDTAAASLLAGTYAFTPDSLLVLENVEHRVFFLETATGRAARFLPVTRDSFWIGPSVGIHFPQVGFMTVRRDSAGVPRELVVSDSANGRRVATRIEPYRREPIVFPSGSISLAGTLRIPPGKKRHPAVVMLHGSGPETRASFDGGLGFLADRFARAGFMVLTYDKRGTGTSGGTYVDDNYDSLSTDAAAAIAWLRTHPAVAPRRIGVWGVSQGGQLAPIVAGKAGQVAFVVNLSGSVVNSNDQEIQRTGLQLQADGFDAADVHDAVALQRLKFDYACTRKNWQTYADAVARSRDKAWYPDPYVGPPEKPDSPAFDFWRCGVEPGLAWEHVKVPALMVVAEHETYSDPAANIVRFEAAMKRAGNKRYAVLRMPGAEHSLKAARTGGLRELPLLDNYVMSAFDRMADWMRAQVGLRH